MRISYTSCSVQLVHAMHSDIELTHWIYVGELLAHLLLMYLTMKKHTAKKRLELHTEKVRNLQVLGDDALRGVVGGAPTGHTTPPDTGYDPTNHTTGG